MSVSYDLFSAAFLAKVTEFDFLKLPPDGTTAMIDGYMKAACARFRWVCKYDLTDRDDTARSFGQEIAPEDLDEIVEIVSEGMLLQWMKPYVYKAELLENVLNTKDFTSYSPSELLLRVVNAYQMCRRDFENLMKEYSYNHGDLSDLSL